MTQLLFKHNSCTPTKKTENRWTKTLLPLLQPACHCTDATKPEKMKSWSSAGNFKRLRMEPTTNKECWLAWNDKETHYTNLVLGASNLLLAPLAGLDWHQIGLRRNMLQQWFQTWPKILENIKRQDFSQIFQICPKGNHWGVKTSVRRHTDQMAILEVDRPAAEGHQKHLEIWEFSEVSFEHFVWGLPQLLLGNRWTHLKNIFFVVDLVWSAFSL